MANQFITDDRTTFQSVGTNETLFVSTSGSVLVDGSTALNGNFATGTRIIVLGEVAGIGSLAAGIEVGFGNDISNALVEVGSTGLVSGGLWGIGISGYGSSLSNAGWVRGGLYGVTINTDAGFDPGSAHTVLTNSGSITGGNDGVRLTGALIDGSNTGSISATAAGGTGLRFESVSGLFVNLGTITGPGTGVLVSGDAATFRNGGTIGSGGTAILVSGDPAWIESSGDLSAGLHGIEMTLTDVPGSTLVNTGAITASLDGIRVLAPGVLIRSTGHIEAGRDGIMLSGATGKVLIDGRIDAGGTGVSVTSNAAKVAVGGRVISAGNGVLVTGSSARIDLTGTVDAGGLYGLRVQGDDSVITSGSRLTASDTGMDVAGNGTTLDNTGTIRGRVEGLHLEMAEASTAHVDNSGAIVGGTYGLFIDAGHLSLMNTGRIAGLNGEAILTYNAARIVNHGAITSTSYGVAIRSYGSEADVLRNFGSITGDVTLFRGNDILRNGGLIDGLVRLGDGDDAYDGRGSALGVRVQGDAGRDVILGGSGADTILGGTGADTMTGGAGADLFIFKTALEASGPINADGITDFQSGTDKIDVSAFMAGAYFLGSAAFTIANQIRYDPVTGWLSGNTDADLDAEWFIMIGNKPSSLAYTDFLV